MCADVSAAPEDPKAERVGYVITVRRHTAVIPTGNDISTAMTFHDTTDPDTAVEEHLWNSQRFGRGIRLDESDSDEADFLAVPAALRGMSEEELLELPGIVAYEWHMHMFPPEEVDDVVYSALERLQDKGRLPMRVEEFVCCHLDLGDPDPDSALESLDWLWRHGYILLPGEGEDVHVSLPDD